jgi:membrane protease YdiL (CAAX protease family)
VLPSFKDAGLSGMEDLIKEFRSWDWGFAVLVVGAGPAVSEELWCRGFLGRGLTRQYGVAVGVLLTSVFFGVMHLDPPQAVATAFLGLVFHYTYVTSRSLWLPMLMHFVNNSVAVVAAKLADPEALPSGRSAVLPLPVYAGAALLLLAVCWALYQSRVRFLAPAEGGPVLWEPDYPGVEHPPAESGVVAVHPWLSGSAAAGVFLALLSFLMSFRAAG